MADTLFSRKIHQQRYCFDQTVSISGLLETLLADTNVVSLCNGLLVGFCATLTSWSSWNQHLSLILIEETPIDGQAQVQNRKIIYRAFVSITLLVFKLFFSYIYTSFLNSFPECDEWPAAAISACLHRGLRTVARKRTRKKQLKKLFITKHLRYELQSSFSFLYLNGLFRSSLACESVTDCVVLAELL